MDCEERDKTVVEKPAVILFQAYERAEAAYERHIKRYWILCLALLVLLVGSNVAWLCFISNYDFNSYSAEVDSGENGDVMYNYIGESMEGDITNGTDKSDEKNDDQAERSAGNDDKNTG